MRDHLAKHSTDIEKFLGFPLQGQMTTSWKKDLRRLEPRLSEVRHITDPTGHEERQVNGALHLIHSMLEFVTHREFLI